MASADPAVRRIHLFSGLIVLGTFLAGALAGAGLARSLRPPTREEPPLQHRGPPVPLPLRELGLTPAQDEQVKQIVERHRPELEAIVRESFPRVRAVNQRIEAEVRALLTPEQQKLLEQLQARRPPPGMHGPRHGPPGGPPPAPGEGPPPGLPPPGGPWDGGPGGPGGGAEGPR